MPEAPWDPVPRLLLDPTPLRTSPTYRRMWGGLTLAQVGSQLGVTAVALQVYDLTRSSFAVGLVGLVSFVPLVLLGLYGGALVDVHDRRRVALLSSLALLLVSAAFAAQAWLHLGSVGLLLVLVALQSAAFAVNSPARSAIVPMLVPPGQLPAANAWGTLSMNVGMTVGPLLAGVLVGRAGYQAAYTIDVATLAVAVWSLVGLPPLPPEGQTHARAGLASVLEGLRLLATWPNVRMTFLLDLSAMVLAQPRALFPAVGAVLLGGGATTAGALAASVAVGSVLASVLSGPLLGVVRHGVAIAVSVCAWGAAVAAFGVVLLRATPHGGGGDLVGSPVPWGSPALWAACGALAAAGAADAVSSVFRNTVLQSAAPDRMRGRLQGVFIVVVAGGPRLGDLVAGTDASALGEALAAVVGGLACVAAVLLLCRWQRPFLAYDARSPVP